MAEPNRPYLPPHKRQTTPSAPLSSSQPQSNTQSHEDFIEVLFNGKGTLSPEDQSKLAASAGTFRAHGPPKTDIMADEMKHQIMCESFASPNLSSIRSQLPTLAVS